MTKSELLDLTRRERQTFDDLFANLTDEELSAPTLLGNWSRKDVLAHIAGWERRLIRTVRAVARGEPASWPEPGYGPADVDRLNERDMLANRDRAIADVVADAQESFDAYIRFIEGLTDQQISADLPQAPGTKFEMMIRGNGDRHYREHIDAIVNGGRTMNKSELLDLTRSERQALDDVFAKLTDDELCAPVLDGGRSMKDSLAHITIWERRVITAITIGRAGETPPWPEPGFMPWDADKLNERDFAANRDCTLADVRAEAQATFDEYVTLLESFSDEEIAGELPYTPGIPLIAILRGHGDEHYRHHLDAMEAWWAGQGA